MKNPIPKPGQTVWVRQRLYQVERVKQTPSGVEVELICIEAGAQGEWLSVLWENETDARIA